MTQLKRAARERIKPVTKPDWTDQQRALLEPFERDGRVYNIFTTLAQHPDLARDWLTFASHILRRSTLPARDREIAILRIGWLCGSEYEFSHHIRIGKRAGLSDEEIKRVMQPPSTPCWSEHDRLLLVAVDELHEHACLSDATWQALAATYDTLQMMDFVFTVGQYNLVSMALNSFGVQLDSNLSGFPK